MAMHNPALPGHFIREIYLRPRGLSIRACAGLLGIAPSTLGRLLNGSSRISPAMAQRLSRTLGRSPESWLIMQNMYDRWKDQLASASGATAPARRA